MASLWRLLALGLSLALAAAQSISPLDTRGQLQVGSPLYSLDLDPEPYDDRVKLHLYPSTSNLFAPDESLKVISFFFVFCCRGVVVVAAAALVSCAVCM